MAPSCPILAAVPYSAIGPQQQQRSVNPCSIEHKNLESLQHAWPDLKLPPLQFARHSTGSWQRLARGALLPNLSTVVSATDAANFQCQSSLLERNAAELTLTSSFVTSLWRTLINARSDQSSCGAASDTGNTSTRSASPQPPLISDKGDGSSGPKFEDLSPEDFRYWCYKISPDRPPYTSKERGAGTKKIPKRKLDLNRAEPPTVAEEKQKQAAGTHAENESDRRAEHKRLLVEHYEDTNDLAFKKIDWDFKKLLTKTNILQASLIDKKMWKILCYLCLNDWSRLEQELLSLKRICQLSDNNQRKRQVADAFVQPYGQPTTTNPETGLPLRPVVTAGLESPHVLEPSTLEHGLESKGEIHTSSTRAKPDTYERSYSTSTNCLKRKREENGDETTSPHRQHP